LILLTSQLQTQQVITSQIRSHIEYLIQTYYYSCAHLIVKIGENLALMMILDSGLLFGHPVCTSTTYLVWFSATSLSRSL